MTLAPGTRLSHYDILAPLGAGGMGEVFRARDTKLGREVAIKVLPEDFVADTERLARFDREARVLASLNHPHIASIYGFEDADDLKFLVMELAEGETLAEHLTKGAIPVDEAIEIARQIAEALETAHEKGIIHRDLKPANVVVDENGKAKVLDFGLAKALDVDESGDSDITNSPTMVRAATNAGVILGTAAYMSPEQARGKKVDRRADIWSFGVVLWEMLAGSRMFLGETVSDTLAFVLTADIDLDKLPSGTPRSVKELVRRCLVRDPKKRLRDIGEARLVLENPEAMAAEAATARKMERPAARALPWALFAFTLVALAALLVLRPGVDESVLKVSIPAPEGMVLHLAGPDPGPPTVSPDGTMVTFSARDESGEVLLWVRDLSRSGAQVLGGTEGAQYPFWSPDSKWIAFFTQRDSTLKKIAVAGGPPVTICPVTDGKGGSWNASGDIVFSPRSDLPIHRVSASGGEPVEVTKIDNSLHNSHRHPRFLPDGKHFFYLARAPRDTGAAIYIASLDGGDPVKIVDSRAQAEFVDGRLLFLRDHVLMSAPFDPAKREITGEALPLIEKVAMIDGAACAVFSSSSRTLVHLPTIGVNQSTLEWRDSSGNTKPIGEPGGQAEIAVSPDGQRVAVSIHDATAGTRDLWLVDVERGIRTRFTYDAAEDFNPVWTPDGSAVIFSSPREGKQGLYRKAVGGTSDEVLLYDSENTLRPTDVSPDGRHLLFNETDPDSKENVMVLALDGSREARPLVETEFTEFDGMFSPDGKWISYCSVAATRPSINATPFPGPGRTIQISAEPAVYPSWRDEDRIVYQSIDGDVLATEVAMSGETLSIGETRKIVPLGALRSSGASYSQTWDGKAFVLNPLVSSEDRLFNLVVNWKKEMETK